MEPIESMISNNSIERHSPYESLAKYVIFPCSNREFGCKTNLKHDQVVNHEKDCTYRQCMCPFYYDSCDQTLKCDWKGAVINLNAHLDVSHTTREINSPPQFLLNMDVSDVKVYFVKINLHTFIIVTRYDDEADKFYCSVMCCDEEIRNNYAYRIEISNKDFCMMYIKSNVEPLIETSKVFKNVNSMIVIDVAITAKAKIYAITIISDFNWKISIIEKTNKSTESASMLEEQVNNQPATLIPHEVPSVTEQKLLELNKLLLTVLKCPICFNFMKPQIYICENGHSFCNECIAKITQCPLCRVKSIDGRNFALEKITEKVLYPCKNSDEGCTEVANLPDITKHQSTCILKTDCPLIMFPISCNVRKGFLHSISHIYENHSQDKFDQNEVCKITLRENEEPNFNVTICDNNIFIVCVTYYRIILGNFFKFGVFTLGMKTNAPVYRCTLEFVSNDKLATQLMVTNLCGEEVPCFHVDRALILNCDNIPRCMFESYIDKNTDGDEVVQFMFKIEKI